MRIGIIDCGLNNLSSVSNALDYLNIPSVSISSSDFNEEITHLIIPGVGSYSEAMKMLHSKNLVKFIQEFSDKNNAVLGICLGMQILTEIGTEFQETTGLGLIPGRVDKIEIQGDMKLPHVGWNNVEILRDSPLWTNIPSLSDFYFLHSYQYHCLDTSHITAQTSYALDIPIAIQSDRIYGVQFHPEKSQKMGLQLLKNFAELC